MKTPYEYAPMIDNTQIISTYTQDHFVQDLGTQEYIVETPDFAYVEDNYVPIVSTYGLQDHYYYDVNPQEYIVETTYPADNSIIEEFAVFEMSFLSHANLSQFSSTCNFLHILSLYLQ